jgi:hypothetical protein
MSKELSYLNKAGRLLRLTRGIWCNDIVYLFDICIFISQSFRR